jgi:hypothetical protein
MLAEESFPYRAGARVECPIMIDDSVDSVQVRLMAGEDVVAERSVHAWGTVFPGHIILACGQSPRSEQALGKVLFPLEPVQVVSLAATELPSVGLDYDSVGAVAMDDPGHALTPSQREALLSWLSGGGSLALTDVKPSGSSLLDALGIPRRAGIETSDGAAVSFGLGRVFASRRESAAFFRDGGSSAWREALDLQPYESTQRLDYSHVFSREEPMAGKPSGTAWSWWLVIPFALWAGGAIAVALLKSGRYAPLLAYSAASLVLAVGGGFALDRSWQRGCRLVSRAVVLPEAGGVLLDASASLNTPRKDDYEDVFDVPRDVSFNFDRTESGRLRSVGPCEWRHGAWKTYFAMRNTRAGTFSLGAALPASILAGADASIRAFSFEAGKPRLTTERNVKRLAYLSDDGERWWDYEAATETWRESGQIPAWLGVDGLWVLRAQGCIGQRGLLVGVEAVPELNLSMQGQPVAKLLWVAPIGPGREI